ncbi:MAG: hypothetical protein GKR94_02325 [Gammaproteobacteria bacterium]|nr:hypothetical protein [Gammaproteobacteria bacterium]
MFLLIAAGLALVGLAQWLLGNTISRNIAALPPALAALEDDTRTFQDALRIRHPWVVLFNATPRASKQHKNRVRFLAGRQRDEPSPRNMWGRLLSRGYGWLAPTKVAPMPGPLLSVLVSAKSREFEAHWLGL